MSYWRDVIAKNSEKHVERLKGCLYLIGDKGLVKYPFNYAIEQNRKYTNSISSLPGDFIEPTESIYTTAVDIPFAPNAAIKLHDGSIMTIADIETVINSDCGKLLAFIIYLHGGIPNDVVGFSNQL